MEQLAQLAALELRDRPMDAFASILSPPPLSRSRERPATVKRICLRSSGSHSAVCIPSQLHSLGNRSSEPLLLLADGARGIARRSAASGAAKDVPLALLDQPSLYGPPCSCLMNKADRSESGNCTACVASVERLPPGCRVAACTLVTAMESVTASRARGPHLSPPSVLELLVRSAAAPSLFHRTLQSGCGPSQWTVDRVHAAVLRRARLCAPGETWLVPLSVGVSLPASGQLPAGLSAGAAASALPRLRRLFLWDACDEGSFSPLHMAAVAVQEAGLPAALARIAANDMARQLLTFRDSLKPEQTALRAALAKAFRRIALLQDTAEALEPAGAGVDASTGSAVGSRLAATGRHHDAAMLRAACTVPLPDLLHLPPLLLPEAVPAAGAAPAGNNQVGPGGSVGSGGAHQRSAAAGTSSGFTQINAAGTSSGFTQINAADLLNDGGESCSERLSAPRLAAGASSSSSSSSSETPSAAAPREAGFGAAADAFPGLVAGSSVVDKSTPSIASVPAPTRLPLELPHAGAHLQSGAPWRPAVVSPPQLIAAWLTARELDFTSVSVQRFSGAVTAEMGAGAGAGAADALAGKASSSLPLRPVCHCFSDFPIDVTAEGEEVDEEADEDAADTEAAKAAARASGGGSSASAGSSGSAAGSEGAGAAGNAVSAGVLAGTGTSSGTGTGAGVGIGVGMRRPRPCPRMAMRAWRWRDSVRLSLAELLPAPMRQALPPCAACGSTRNVDAALSAGDVPTARHVGSVASSGSGSSSRSRSGIGNPIVRYADALVLSKQMPARMHAPVVAALAGAVNAFLADIASLRVALVPPSRLGERHPRPSAQHDDNHSIDGGSAAPSLSRPLGGTLETAVPSGADVTVWMGEDGVPRLAVGDLPIDLL